MTFVALAVFLAIATAMLAVGLSVRDFSARRYDRIDHRLGLGDAAASPPITLEPPLPKGGIDRWFFRLVESSGSRLDSSVALAIVMGAALLGCGLPLLIWDNLLAAAVGLVIGGLLPLMWWEYKAARRRLAIARDLPDTLDVLADCVRSGRNFEQAATMVATDMKGPLADEFQYCAHQMRLGHTLGAVLERMVRRVPLPEFKMFAVAVTVHRQTGGNLAVLTQRLAAAARDRQEFRGHLAAVTAGSRLSAIGLVVGSMAGVAALVWIEPSYLEKFMSNHLGPPMLAVAAGLMVIGGVWVWRVLRVKY